MSCYQLIISSHYVLFLFKITVDNLPPILELDGAVSNLVLQFSGTCDYIFLC